jgi:hypothetical protein
LNASSNPITTKSLIGFLLAAFQPFRLGSQPEAGAAAPICGLSVASRAGRLPVADAQSARARVSSLDTDVIDPAPASR